jgi:predicted Fe-S protein YdhL (DUF1289 family)
MRLDYGTELRSAGFGQADETLWLRAQTDHYGKAACLRHRKTQGRDQCKGHLCQRRGTARLKGSSASAVNRKDVWRYFNTNLTMAAAIPKNKSA